MGDIIQFKGVDQKQEQHFAYNVAVYHDDKGEVCGFQVHDNELPEPPTTKLIADLFECATASLIEPYPWSFVIRGDKDGRVKLYTENLETDEQYEWAKDGFLEILESHKEKQRARRSTG